MFIKVYKTGTPVQEYFEEEAVAVGDFLRAKGVSTEGRAIVVNGETVDAGHVIRSDATVTLAKASKGGNA